MPEQPGMLVGLRRLVNRSVTKPTGQTRFDLSA